MRRRSGGGGLRGQVYQEITISNHAPLESVRLNGPRRYY